MFVSFLNLYHKGRWNILNLYLPLEANVILSSLIGCCCFLAKCTLGVIVHSSKFIFLNGCFSDDTNGSFMLTGALLAQRCFNFEQRNIVYGDMN